ncbi:hypothetical protein A8924_2266 [Saccharopolyspora erythraea NRRL 2338]|uniref:Uncharacterized protein n=2 Tax=Saccharopolyspora erythraea TaxID=1836 RepID=A4FAV4_SACEN|nr:hypothetical protein [Saccharopolyspora erythraea]EQD87631.1 hypothetical protein N599_03305 [Saccharopolyspora erythraea D]PFG94961.1 hypothetical protein A8924_2266 [Saccharopolyspora erythraea NRRL 2338]QRK91653.1 hypothetical protein JQX30_09885 [Saccharopolyspora erythraea]CAM01179.1 hypothetical protein SACE_1867 [Saccharopolyspora erythraea NRRL 2338]
MTATDEELVEQVAAAVLAHPSVLRLDGGEYGVVATHLPGRRVTGVRSRDDGTPAEVAVVLRLDRPLPEIIAELRAEITRVAGRGPVDITVSDVEQAGA